MTIWMDLTHSMRDWKGGVVGILRAELEIAKNLHKVAPWVRFCVYDGKGYVVLQDSDLEWLWNSDSVGDAYCQKFDRYNKQGKLYEKFINEHDQLKNALSLSPSRAIRLREASKLVLNSLPKSVSSVIRSPARSLFDSLLAVARLRTHKSIVNTVNLEFKGYLYFPFNSGDVVFTCGWLTSGKELCLEQIKRIIDIKVVYTIYDIIILLPGLRQFYTMATVGFANYIAWISKHADYVIYGGRTAQEDTEKYLQERSMRTPPGGWVKFGSSVTEFRTDYADEYPKQFGKYILAVGTLEPRKNYTTLYDCYKWMLKTYSIEDIPNLVIVGKVSDEWDLVDRISHHPVLSAKIFIVQPTDNELRELYVNALFTLLPSLYEGWSLTLPEALNYGKVCICSDVRPLREIAEGLVPFVDPISPVLWGKEIMRLATNPQLVEHYESLIAERWVNSTWEDCARMVLEKIDEACQFSKEITDEDDRYVLPATQLRENILEASTLCLNDYIKFASKAYLGYENGISVQKVTHQKKPVLKMLKKALLLLISVLPMKSQLSLGKLISFLESKNEKTVSSSLNEYQLSFVAKANSTVLNFDSLNEVVLNYLEGIKYAKNFRVIHVLPDISPLALTEEYSSERLRTFDQALRVLAQSKDKKVVFGESSLNIVKKWLISNGFEASNWCSVDGGAFLYSSKSNFIAYEAFRLKYNLCGKYLVALDALGTFLDMEVIYRAYQRLLNTGGEIPQIIFVLRQSRKNADISRRMRSDERFAAKFIFTEDSDDWVEIVRKAEFILMPSLEAGWNQILVECLAMRKLCVCSSTESNHRIAGKAAIYFDVYDDIQLANIISDLSQDASLLKQKEEKVDCWRVVDPVHSLQKIWN